MGSLKANSFISTLINTGADASLNLFTANIYMLNTGLNNSNLSFRITSFPQTPQRDVPTQELSFLGTSINIPVYGSTLKRSSSFVVRIDEDYQIYDLLRDLQCVNDNGVFKEQQSKRFNLKIEAYRPTRSLGTVYDYISIYSWDFKDCYITTVSPLAYSYDSSNNATATVGFIYKTFKGIPVEGDSSLSRVTPEDIVQGGISDIRNLIQSGINQLFD